MPHFKTTHNLDFLSRPFVSPLNDGYNWYQFKIGTVTGLWGCAKKSYVILALENEEAGNGHLDDVFEWFEHSCKRDKMNLKILECFNQNFKKHLIEKRGFTIFKDDDLFKRFN